MALPDGVQRDHGDRFLQAGVVSRYHFRPPYPSTLFERLAGLVGGHAARALDLGCGPGKLTGSLRAFADTVDAVDPSRAMLDVARRTVGVGDPAISWHCSTAEAAAVTGPYELIVAGASFHWMDAAAVIARCREWLAPNGWFVVLDGDGAIDPAWSEDLRDVLIRYLSRLKGRTITWQHDRDKQPLIDDPGFVHAGRDVTALTPFRQPLDDFVESFHSRQAFAVDVMGDELAAAFREDLRAAVQPWCDPEGHVCYDTQVRYEWGRPG